MYPIYDVYNNAYRSGGKLNVSLDRYYMVDKMKLGSLSGSIYHQKLKYDNRANMSDITLRACSFVSINFYLLVLLSLIERTCYATICFFLFCFFLFISKSPFLAKNASQTEIIEYNMATNNKMQDSIARQGAHVSIVLKDIYLFR